MNILPSTPNCLSAPVGVVACDAGAANLIAAWLPLFPEPLHVCAEGPARSIIQKRWPECIFKSLEKVIKHSAVVLTGTGWSSDLEHNARREAKHAAKPTLAVIDHWVNYRDRFIRGEEKVLPDVIIVTDDYAKREAERCFEQACIVQWHNLYLAEEVKKIKMLRVHDTISIPKKILMVMEPIRAIWPGDKESGEFVAVKNFIENLPLLNLSPDQVTIQIRPHPSDSPDKYVNLIQTFHPIEMTINKETSLSADLGWADLVVGCNSFALVIALQAGIPTMSILPKQAPRCKLPQNGLQHLIDLMV